MEYHKQKVLEELPRLFTQGTAIRKYIEQLQTIDNELVTTLAELEEMLDEQLIILTVEGHDPLSISQMSALIPGYRETLLRIKIHLSAFQQDHFKGQEEDEHTDHPLSSEELHSTMFSLFDDLLLRFRTLLAAEPDIAQYGQRLINQVQQYKEQVLIFHDALQKLDLQIFVINGMQEDMLSIMRESDDRIADTTGKIQQRMLRVIGRSKEIITILSGIIVIVLLFGWLVTHWMTRPLLDLSFAAEQLADGDPVQ